jgi:predicted O-linked N-acetylglucosamine transferase (SPINDLY family)
MSDSQKAHTRETLVLMPGCYQANDSQRPKPEPTTRKEHGLAADSIVLCCFNNHFKITEPVFTCWMEVLKASPNSVLWLLSGSSETENNLKKSALSKGVAADRLIFAPVLPLQQHLSRLALADISLDTLPYNAHTTASDALWAGVPHVGLLGNSFAARVSSSLLHAIAMPELITENFEDYQSLLKELTRKPKKLKSLRAKLAVQKDESPLFDSAQFAKHLESA